MMVSSLPMTTAASIEISPADLEADVRAFREARFRRLVAEKGWLTVIGKVWLTEGKYRVGSAPGSEIPLPEGAPPNLGTVTVEGGVARLEANPSVDLYVRGERIVSIFLRSDAEPDPDDVVAGSITLQLIRRGRDLAIRVRDSASPARTSFTGIPAYAIDPRWRIVARLDPFVPEKEVILTDGDGRPESYLSPGELVFEKDGRTWRVEPVFEGDRRRLFVLFADQTNREDTYGAGRFLYAPLPEEGRVVLDFNKAFNPPCAFTPYATCPLPPPENRLPLRVEAGEKRPLGL
jgi:uncharacterized protein (DUF1684 family)